MAKRNPMDRDEPARPELSRAERKLQRALLSYVLDLYPKRPTVVSAGHAIAGKDAEGDEANAFARALRDLALVGLIETRGGRVAPTPAALRFDALEMS